MHELLYARTWDPICYKYSYNIDKKCQNHSPSTFTNCHFLLASQWCLPGVRCWWQSHQTPRKPWGGGWPGTINKYLKGPVCCLAKYAVAIRVLRNRERERQLSEIETWRSDSENLSALDKFVQDGICDSLSQNKTKYFRLRLTHKKCWETGEL